MKTGFVSDEHTRHEAKMAKLSNERAIVDGEQTWQHKLNALYTELLATVAPGEVSKAALALANELLTLELAAGEEAASAERAKTINEVEPADADAAEDF